MRHSGSALPSTEGGRERDQTYTYIYIYIYIYIQPMHVRSPFASSCCSHFKAAQAFGVTMAADRLSLLCRKTRVLPAQVFQLVRDYLFVHVGASCPWWLNRMLKDKLRALPRGRYRRITASFLVSKTIEYDVYRQDDYEYGRSNPPLRVPKRGQPVQVEVRLEYSPNFPTGRWWLWCGQGDYLLRSGEGMWATDVFSTFLSELSEIRSRFDESEPRGSMEVPTTWRDWRRFIRLYLFGHGDRCWSCSASRWPASSVATAARRACQPRCTRCTSMARPSARSSAPRPTWCSRAAGAMSP